MPNADGLLDLPAKWREFRCMSFANSFDDAGRAACGRLLRLDLNPAKRGGLLQFPFLNAKRAGKVADSHSIGVLV